LKQSIVITSDGSHSLINRELNETYHSTHGAVQESMHVFIENGLRKCAKQQIDILEVGFGTGLNAFLTLLEAEKRAVFIHYTTIELFPIEKPLWSLLNYTDNYSESQKEQFYLLHGCDWGTENTVTKNFTIRKVQADFTNYQADKNFDLIFFDAFSPEKQPQLWSEGRFRMLASHCKPGAILTTYCAKGVVKQALRNAGFTVERLPGAPGKRHMLRATINTGNITGVD
jgi:tRNA U34 5-methylaminomethyl-2-thiouridine-forming methyltransferase MnmC